MYLAMGSEEQFGRELSAWEDALAISASAQQAGTRLGKVEIYERVGLRWEPSQTLFAEPDVPESRFGYLSDMRGDLLILSEWNEFRQPDMDRVKEAMEGHVIFDGRNLYDPADMSSEGFDYFSIG